MRPFTRWLCPERPPAGKPSTLNPIACGFCVREYAKTALTASADASWMTSMPKWAFEGSSEHCASSWNDTLPPAGTASCVQLLGPGAKEVVASISVTSTVSADPRGL